MVVQALSPFTVTTRIDRVHCKPWGLDGGGDAMGNGIGVRHKGEWETDLPNAKIFNVRLERGDAYMMQSGGGGGFGDPLERDPELVAEDVREGYVSPAVALNVYGVVLTTGGEVDVPATQARRKGKAPGAGRGRGFRNYSRLVRRTIFSEATMAKAADIDPLETREWLNSLHAVLQHNGSERASFLIGELTDAAQSAGLGAPFAINTPYINTLPAERGEHASWDRDIEHRIRSIIRWNAVAIILRANKHSSELGGHIASFQSAATLYDIGFGHFWHAPTDKHGGDLIYIQGHSAPGIYARAFVEGRLTEEQLLNFRQETGGKGLSSYPHPWLMPDFWQFPTVSMGLGPLMAIYQARFLKYLHGRGIADTKPRKVWAFLGDGECDEPESLGAISLAGREHLDNLIFVINCNLQRLDGPVRGNGKIVQELEGLFHGAGWNVIKVLWGSGWDRLFAKDKSGQLRKRMEECVDGEYQDFKSKNGAYVRQQFFNKYPETAALVKDMSDDEIWSLRRGGHDPEKVYAAYAAAVKHTRQPTVILAKTVKGYGMGEAGEGQNITHQQKKMGLEALRKFRDRFSIPVSDAQIEDIPFLTLGEKERQYLEARRRALGGPLPQRRAKSASLDVPQLAAFSAQLASTEDREISTTMAFVRILNTLLRDKTIGKYRGADRARQVAHLRHGRNVPPVRHLFAGRPAL